MSDSFREVVVRAGFAGDRDVLNEALAHPDPHMRVLAMGGLARCGDLTTSHVRAGLADRDRIVRSRAVELAVDMLEVDLVPMLDDADDLVVETAAFALGERGQVADEAVDRLAELVHDHDISICREAAVAALGAIGDSRALPAILAATEDRAPVRRRAVIALAPFTGPEVQTALERALTDRDRQVRQAAEDLLGD